ncbi:hypothetical protein PILCRDRAFT_819445 [Piloderma croceum F 1598]|uniref:Histone chaperone domain-containing protein n=1 Tax=Piloderma croceum (strain F 1598) TaxID=765440 RepID=A0A0C3FUW6_PILCF|nr:hypothetical protein PILCRDRAFT_819445 [Piloderma croceum F 1598]
MAKYSIRVSVIDRYHRPNSMSTDATSPSGASANNASANDASIDKGKGKGKVVEADDNMEDEEEEEEDDDVSDDEEEEEEEEEDESLQEIDPSVILPGSRRTRGVKVDYTSPEALAKAQLKPEDNDDDSDDDVHMKDD